MPALYPNIGIPPHPFKCPSCMLTRAQERWMDGYLLDATAGYHPG